MIEITDYTLINQLDMWVPITHGVPAEPLSPLAAHQIMQEHRARQVDICARKRRAWETLVDAGRIVPDTGRTR